jgi:hypothetical protein
MLALLLLACNPWTEVLEREQGWYDADRIESELGIDLVEISAGEPIGYSCCLWQYWC